MKKLLLWIGGILVFLVITVLCLVFFYPDQKLESFDDLKLNLPQISEDQNGYEYVLEAYKVFNPLDIYFYDLNEFFKSGKLEDVKELPDFYPLLKANSNVLKAIDMANEFDYLIPDTDLKGNDSLGDLFSKFIIPSNFVSVNKLLITRVLYKLQKGNEDGALDNLLDLIKFQNKSIFISTDLVGYSIQSGALDNSLYVLNLMLNNSDFNENDYLSLLEFFNNLSPNFIIGRENALKFEFNFGIKMRQAMVDDVDHDYLSRSKFHYQPSKTTNVFAENLRKMINDLFYSADADMLKLSDKYNDNYLLLLVSPNSYGEVLMSTSMPNSFGCRPLVSSFDFNSLRLLVAIKLYEIKNNKVPHALDDLVPDYFEDLNWLNFRDERIVDYNSKIKVLFSDFLQENCKIQKNVDLIK